MSESWKGVVLSLHYLPVALFFVSFSSVALLFLFAFTEGTAAASGFAIFWAFVVPLKRRLADLLYFCYLIWKRWKYAVLFCLSQIIVQEKLTVPCRKMFTFFVLFQRLTFQHYVIYFLSIDLKSTQLPMADELIPRISYVRDAQTRSLGLTAALLSDAL